MNSFDFDSFKSMFNSAMEGLEDTMGLIKELVVKTEDVAKEIGSDKLTKTTESFNEIMLGVRDTFESVKESFEEVHTKYSRLEAAVN